jgi:hypothetical protein
MICRYFAFGGDTNRFCLANAGITPRSIVRTYTPCFGFWLRVLAPSLAGH